MKHLEEQLGKKLPPMGSEFREKLRAQLFEKAQIKATSSFSFLSLFLNHFRQFSYIYGMAFLIFLFPLVTYFKAPLSAQKVLANALENYESSGDIYHEKIIHERYENGVLVESSMDENYFDDKGQFLQLIKNPYTEDISRIHLSVVDAFGEKYYFDTPWAGFEADPEAQKKALEYYQSEKIRCVSTVETVDRIAQVSLIFVKNNPSNYSVKPFVLWKDEGIHQALSSYYGAWEMQQNNEERIRSLAALQPENYEKVQKEGRLYYVFQTYQSDDREIWSYLDAQTFRLTLQEIRYASNSAILEKSITVLEEYLNSNDHPHIFDPQRFPEIEISTNYLDASDLRPEQFFKEDGCYDSSRETIDQNILKSLDEKALQEWFDQIDRIDFSLRAHHQLEASISFPFHFESIRWPTRSRLKKEYVEGFAGWQFETASESEVDVYSILEGKIVDIQRGEWNQGDGNVVIISHQVEGNEFHTRYSYLSDIVVKVGQKVKSGEKIAEMGKTGRYSSLENNIFYLDFELLLLGHKLNPELLWSVNKTF